MQRRQGRLLSGQSSCVSPTYIYQLEQGLKSPTVEYLGYICAGLNISLAEFFAEEQSEKNVA